MKQKETKVRVKRYSYYDFSDNFKEFLKDLDAVYESIPEKYRDSAGIDFDLDLDSFYNSPSCNVEVYYYRPETKDERKSRLKIVRERNKAIKEREEKEYKRLLKKFGEKNK